MLNNQYLKDLDSNTDYHFSDILYIIDDTLYNAPTQKELVIDTDSVQFNFIDGIPFLEFNYLSITNKIITFVFSMDENFHPNYEAYEYKNVLYSGGDNYIEILQILDQTLNHHD